MNSFLFYMVLTYSNGAIAGPPPIAPMPLSSCVRLIEANQKLRQSRKWPKVTGSCVKAI